MDGISILLLCTSLNDALYPTAKKHNGREECATQEPETPFFGWATLLLSDHREALFCPGLCKWRRGIMRRY